MNASLRTTLLIAALGVSACTPLIPVVPDTAVMPAGGLGAGFDPDVTAVNLAQYAFADSSRTYGRPADAARAAASLDYIAGQIYTSPRWSNISALTKEELLQGRAELRTALGVAPGTTSQQLVNSLTGAGNALAAGDEAAALRQLGAPVFTGTGTQVLAILSNMPYLRMANVATMHVANQLFQDGNDERF